MKNKIKIIINSLNEKRQRHNRTVSYHRFYKQIITHNPGVDQSNEGESEWLQRWRKYDKKISPLSYRIFSHYIGPNIDILPMEICVNDIEPILTPIEFWEYYSDKCMLDKIIGSTADNQLTPITYLRNIRGKYYVEYCPLASTVESVIESIPTNKVIVKPSLDNSGHGVQLFSREDGNEFRNKNGELLNSQLLEKTYHSNFLVQECFQQSDFTAQFNPTSVNTIRMATYRDGKGVVHPLGAIMRIGGAGSFVDNAHAGGMFVGINSNGELGHYLSNQYGERETAFNGVDFLHAKYEVPRFSQIQQFAVRVSSNILHHDLVALDIILDKDNQPKVLETNVQAFSGWLFQFVSCPALGDYTEEVMERCISNRR